MTMWLCRIVTGVIPSLWLLWLLYGYLARFAPEAATRKLVLVAYALGSMAFTYSIQFYAHQLSAVCIAAAWILGDGVAMRERSPRTMLAVGFLAALAPAVDYQTAFAVLPLAGYVVARMWTWPRAEIVRAFGLAAVRRHRADRGAPLLPLGVFRQPVRDRLQLRRHVRGRSHARPARHDVPEVGRDRRQHDRTEQRPVRTRAVVAARDPRRRLSVAARASAPW